MIGGFALSFYWAGAREVNPHAPVENTMTKTFLLIAAFGSFLTAADGQILGQLPASPLQVVSTVPGNGDVNPYGVAFVPSGFASGGLLRAGDIVVSNFNNSGNFQGTGTTIVSIAPDGTPSLFFQGAAGLGLSTALGVLREGVVLVGNVPTTDGTFGTIQQGSLIAIDRWGHQIASFTDSTFLDGPWDLTLVDHGSRATVFVSNVLNGTVSRLELRIGRDGEHVSLDSATQIAKGYLHRGDPNALAIGPTGLAYDEREDELFVASTGDNAIYAIRNAGERWQPETKGRLVYQDDAHLRGPLGLLQEPDGNFITTNGDAINGDPNFPSEMVEFTRAGKFLAQYSVDLGGQGGAFGLALAEGCDGMRRLAAVDDVVNTLEVWTLQK